MTNKKQHDWGSTFGWILLGIILLISILVNSCAQTEADTDTDLFDLNLLPSMETYLDKKYDKG